MKVYSFVVVFLLSCTGTQAPTVSSNSSKDDENSVEINEMRNNACKKYFAKYQTCYQNIDINLNKSVRHCINDLPDEVRRCNKHNDCKSFKLCVDDKSMEKVNTKNENVVVNTKQNEVASVTKTNQDCYHLIVKNDSEITDEGDHFNSVTITAENYCIKHIAEIYVELRVKFTYETGDKQYKEAKHEILIGYRTGVKPVKSTKPELYINNNSNPFEFSEMVTHYQCSKESGNCSYISEFELLEDDNELFGNIFKNGAKIILDPKGKNVAGDGVGLFDKNEYQLDVEQLKYILQMAKKVMKQDPNSALPLKMHLESPN